MTKKKVLIDLRDLRNPNCGFGQIAINYAKHFSALQLDDIRFVFLVPEKCDMDFGGNVEVVRFTKQMKKNQSLLPQVDLWHSVNQNQRVQRLEGDTRFVYTIHDLNWLREKGWASRLKHRWQIKRMIRKADALTCISKFVGEEIQQNFNLRATPLQVIYDAVERIDQKPQTKPSFATGRPFFFAIGQIRRKKNFHLLVDVMKDFPDYDLYICGDDHFDWAKVIRDKIQASGLTNVRLTGKITDPERIWLYANCQAFLFPSQGEGFGLPAIEAMQFGKAVFVAPCTCLPEIAGGHAHVWHDLQPSTLVAGINDFLPHFYDRPDRVAAMKDYAFSFSYENHIQQYIDFYRKILFS